MRISNIDIIKDSISTIQDDTLKFAMTTMLDEHYSKLTSRTLRRSAKENYIRLINYISKLSMEDITWDFLCNLAHSNEDIIYWIVKFLYTLLTYDIYKGSHKEKLLSIIDVFNNHNYYLNIFCYKEVEYLFYYNNDTRKEHRRSLFLLQHHSPKIRELLQEFLLKNLSVCTVNNDLYIHFEDSLGDIKIEQISDFSYTSFKQQFNYFAKDHDCKFLHHLISFYRFVIEHPLASNISILLPGDGVSLVALRRPKIAKEICDGYLAVYYNPFEEPPLFDRWILHINAFEDTSTKLNSNSTFLVDFSAINNILYRRIAKEFFWKYEGQSISSKISPAYNYPYIFNTLEELKDTYNRNSDEKISYSLITVNEAYLFKKSLLDLDVSIETRNQYIYTFRSILNYSKENNLMDFESGVIEYLSRYRHQNANNAKAIPTEHIILLNDLLKKNADDALEKHLKDNSESLAYYLYYAVFHLCLETEFRVSQIAHLKTNCIVDTLKNNKFLIRSTSKTSNGQIYEDSISIYTKLHLDDIKTRTDSSRKNCKDKNIAQYLFIFTTYQKNYYKTINKDDFYKYITKCCDQLNIPRYSAQNLRDTHMTRAEEYRLRTNKSDAILSVLSGHKHKDTTDKYIENNLTDILEATYGIIIGNVDINGHIVKSISNSSITSKENVVDDGCGYCEKNTCTVDTLIGCLLCHDFITSCDNLPFFEKKIKQIDFKIQNSTTLHEKEDYINIKRLHVAYMRAIYILMEDN